MRNGVGWVLLAVLLIGGLLLHATPATALSSVLTENRPAVRLPWDPIPPAPPAFSPAIPPFFAARCLLNQEPTILPLVSLLGATAFVFAGTLWLEISRAKQDAVGEGTHNARRTRQQNGKGNPFFIELRLLLRDLPAHTNLRGPAALLLSIAYAWIVPNLGNDAVRNLTDLLGMGAVLYLIVWQMQLVCNRFGSEAGHAATLFSLPGERWRLILAKNAALASLLLTLDGSCLAFFAGIAGNPRLIPTLLLVLPAVLLLFTALGNIVSVLAPFPLPRKTERYEREPDRSLIFVYILVGIGTWFLFLPALMLEQVTGKVSGTITGLAYSLAIYAASVAIATWLLTARREQQLMTALDGIK